MTTGKDDRGDQNRSLNNSKRLANEAISLGFSVVVFVIIGVVLDNVFKTAPLFILLGVFFALASMAYFLWRIIRAE